MHTKYDKKSNPSKSAKPKPAAGKPNGKRNIPETRTKNNSERKTKMSTKNTPRQKALRNGKQPDTIEPRRGQRTNNGKRTDNGNLPKQQRKNNQSSATSSGKSKPAVSANLPNHFGIGRNVWYIGPEKDARNHMGWRKLGQHGAFLHTSFIPPLANRIDQVYYRRNFVDTVDNKRKINTFGISLIFQDSRLPRNSINSKNTLTEEQKLEYLNQMQRAFKSVLQRTTVMLNGDRLPSNGLVIDDTDPEGVGVH